MENIVGAIIIAIIGLGFSCLLHIFKEHELEELPNENDRQN